MQGEAVFGGRKRKIPWQIDSNRIVLFENYDSLQILPESAEDRAC